MPTDKLELRSEDWPLLYPFPGSLPRESRETQKRRERVAGGDGTGERGRFSYGNKRRKERCAGFVCISVTSVVSESCLFSFLPSFLFGGLNNQV